MTVSVSPDFALEVESVALFIVAYKHNIQIGPLLPGSTPPAQTLHDLGLSFQSISNLDWLIVGQACTYTVCTYTASHVGILHFY